MIVDGGPLQRAASLFSREAARKKIDFLKGLYGCFEEQAGIVQP
jgi:hypothetical protein